MADRGSQGYQKEEVKKRAFLVIGVYLSHKSITIDKGQKKMAYCGYRWCFFFFRSFDKKRTNGSASMSEEREE